MAQIQSLITTMTAHVKPHMNKNEEQHRMPQGLHQKLLETTQQPPLATPEMESGVITPPTCTSSKTNADDERWPRGIQSTELQNRSHGICYTFPEGNRRRKQNSRLRKVLVLEASGITSLKTGAPSGHTCRKNRQRHLQKIRILQENVHPEFWALASKHLGL